METHTMETCRYIFKRGKNAGQSCTSKTCPSSKFCRTHKKYEKTSDTTIESIPSDILSIIVNNLVHTSTRNIKLIHVLEATSKTFQNIIKEEDIYTKCWEKMLTTFEEYPLPPQHNLSVKNCLQLYADHGCQLCNKPRYKKVYPEYGVRCCQDCLFKNTISEHKLRINYKLKTLGFLQSARKRKVKMYNLYAHVYSYGSLNETIFYWKDDVDAIMLEKHNCTLREYRDKWLEDTYKKNYDKLVEFCTTKPDITPQAMIDNSNFDLYAYAPIRDFTPYYKSALQNIRNNEIFAFLSQFADYMSFRRYDIVTTLYFNQLMRNTKALNSSDWNMIKIEINRKR